ncbi:MAG: ferrous iron efflux protein F [Methanobacterium sp. PtaU1.Bin097]|nr:MAG: ferrous iron efflux protein F [Methanobacterium sp. PtaU1.Bin097]
MDENTRKKTGRKAVTVAISGNILLTIFNFVVGILSGSTALVAEAAHTLSDVITSIITAIGFRIGLKPPDSEHPYGHGRAEPLVGLVIVVFLVFIAYEIISEAYSKLLLMGSLTPPDWTAALMAIIGIAVNIIMTRYMMNVGKKINSPAIIADAQHQKVDVFSCAAIVVGVVGSNMGLLILDPLVAVLIAVLVLKIAFDVGKENINNLMGKVPSTDLIVEITKAGTSVKGVKGMHDIKVNYMGPNASVDLHITVDPELSLRNAHKIAHQVEKSVINRVDIVSIVYVHVCPEGEDEDVCLEE